MTTRITDIKIPVLKLRELETLDNGNSISIFYSNNDESKMDEDLELIKKACDEYGNTGFIDPFGHKDRTKVEDKTWYVKDDINIYTDPSSTKETGLISNNDKPFERTYWALLEKQA